MNRKMTMDLVKDKAKKLFTKKWAIVIALSIVTVSLFVTTVSVYAKNKDNKAAIIEQLQEADRQIKGLKKKNSIARALKEQAEAIAEPTQVVAAAAEETPAEDTSYTDEEYYEEDYYEEYYEEEYSVPAYTGAIEEYYTAGDLRFHGVLYAGGWRWTWYSQNVLPGGGLSIPGRHVDENGFVCDENDRICLASSDLAFGTVVATPFGKEGCVYDCGCDSGTLDVYVDF